MAGTFSQIYIQVVFAVKHRRNLIRPEWKGELHAYMGGIIKNKGHYPIIINGMPDHVHLFIGLKPSMAVADLVRDVKNNASNFIKDNKWTPFRFSWQRGYGVFSYSHRQLDVVYKYIQNQEQQHRKKTFREEYLELLDEFAIEYEERFLFDWIA